MKALFTVASKEFNDGLRNRWLLSITVIFAALAIGLSYFSASVSGSEATLALTTLIASLASLAVVIIPLIALLLSYDSFIGEQENGTLLLLITYPLSKSQLLLGKFIGQGSIIALATLLGFGSAAVLLLVQQHELVMLSAVLTSFTVFITSAILLGLSFTAIAFIISLSVSEKSKAAGIALMLWFLFALAFDLALLALLVGSDNYISQNTLTQLMMLNPADIFRLINLSIIDNSATLDNIATNGVIASAIHSSLSPIYLFLTLVGWVVLPLALALFIFKKKNL